MKREKIFKETKARSVHNCLKCGKGIQVKEIYFREEDADKFLHSLHNKKFCQDCYRNFISKN